MLWQKYQHRNQQLLLVLAEKLKEDEGYFYNKNSFLDIFKGLTRLKQEKDDESEEAPESLD